MFKVAPLQQKIYKLTLTENNKNNFNWTNFRKLYIEWDIWGLIATLAPLAAFVMMILKIPA